MKNVLSLFDKKLINLINKNMKSKFMDRFMVIYTNVGSLLFVCSFTLALIIFGKERVQKAGVESAVTLIVSQGITYTLKMLLGRERPYNVLKDLNTYNIILKDYSFPSGHTSASFSIATIIAFNMPQLSWFAIICALLVGISRIYLAVHYPTDVLAGIIIGVGTGIFTHLYFMNLLMEIVSSFFLNN